MQDYTCGNVAFKSKAYEKDIFNNTTCIAICSM